jgi:RNA polymerase sigma factor (sigma-70 family)
VYRLALRFFSDPEDAADATQEILVQVVTHLGSFEGRSKFTTWVYTIACRHLAQSRRRHVEASVAGPERFGEWLDTHLAPESYRADSEVEYRMLCEEVRISCIYGMLLTLSRELRLAYVLGDLLEMTDVKGAEALGISRAAFRQRVARARASVRPIIAGRCSVVDPTGSCSCDRQVGPSLECGLIPATGPVFVALRRGVPAGSAGGVDMGHLRRAADELDVAERCAEVLRTEAPFQAPQRVLEELRRACPGLPGMAPCREPAYPSMKS